MTITLNVWWCIPAFLCFLFAAGWIGWELGYGMGVVDENRHHAEWARKERERRRAETRND